MNEQMAARMLHGQGFIAALDQSGGSTPGALREYGVPDSAWSDEAGMFRLIHEMRVRIMTAPSFRSDKVLAAILFEGTMDGEVDGRPTPDYLWRERGIVPFVKVDKGLEAEKDGVSLMKPMPALDRLLSRAAGLGVFGTKMRSTINLASADGIAAIVAQQFTVAEQISRHGLMPIVEPEVLKSSAARQAAETILRDELLRHLDALPASRQVMLKLSIPEIPDFYEALTRHDRVARVVALSGGHSLDEACRRLAQNHGMIASFSRALIGDLRADMNEADFDAAMAAAIAKIYTASTVKQ